MKILHMSDLHIGKKVNEFSMLEDQKYILNQTLQVIDEHKIDCVLLCGDIYDRNIPPIEAVKVLDSFLSELHTRNLPVLMIGGNHDSADRLNFGQEIFKDSNIYISARYTGHVQTVTFEDEFGEIVFHLLPFVKPVYVNHILGTEAPSYEAAVQEILNIHKVDTDKRNILLAHQFVTASNKKPELSESETKTLGGIDNVDIHVFKDFDYVALGHIHKPQAMGSKYIRYGGSLLKYSFSEANIDKSLTIIDYKEKGNIQLDFIKLQPLHDMVMFESTIQDILDKKTLSDYPSNNYVAVTLTDEEEIIDAIGKVRSIYPNVMMISFKNRRSDNNQKRVVLSQQEIYEHTPIELFEKFYKWQNNSELTKSQQEILTKTIEKAGEDL